MSDLTNPADIRPDHLEIVQNILREHLPAGFKVWVFGSRANWTTKDSSDLDLAVEGADTLDYKAMVGLEVAFEESDLPYTVDVVDLNAVSPSFKKIVEEQRVTLLTAIGELPGNSGWSEVTLGDVATMNDSTYSPKEAWAFINYLDTGNITENRISEIQHLVAGLDKIPSRARRKVEAGDIVFSTVRPNHRHFGLVRNVPDNFLASTGFAVIRGKENVACTDFIYWFLAQDHIVEYLHSIAENSTSAYPSIRPGDLEQLTLSLPPLPEQRAIAHILGTLDDKIELNRRMNQTLEEMARAIFQDWFVDFGPVRTKLDGREPYLPPELWALFPERLVDSELGQMLDGWGVGKVGQCFNLAMGQSPPVSTYNENGVGLPFFQGRSDFGFRYPENRKFCTAPTRVADADDTLVSVRAPVGDINMAWERCCIGRGLAALRHKSGSSSFTYYAVEELQQEIRQYEHTGTVFGAITKKQFEALLTREPPSEVVELFNTYVLSLDERIWLNVASSRALAALRDALLQRLVSGEMQVFAQKQ